MSKKPRKKKSSRRKSGRRRSSGDFGPIMTGYDVEIEKVVQIMDTSMEIEKMALGLDDGSINLDDTVFGDFLGKTIAVVAMAEFLSIVSGYQETGSKRDQVFHMMEELSDAFVDMWTSSVEGDGEEMPPGIQGMVDGAHRSAIRAGKLAMTAGWATGTGVELGLVETPAERRKRWANRELSDDDPMPVESEEARETMRDSAFAYFRRLIEDLAGYRTAPIQTSKGAQQLMAEMVACRAMADFHLEQVTLGASGEIAACIFKLGTLLGRAEAEEAFKFAHGEDLPEPRV